MAQIPKKPKIPPKPRPKSAAQKLLERTSFKNVELPRFARPRFGLRGRQHKSAREALEGGREIRRARTQAKRKGS